MKALCILLKKPIYVFIVMAQTLLFFLISGVQYWCTHYLENVLGATKAEIFAYFIFTCLTAPIMGALFSGWLTSKLGGYESNRILPVAVAGCLFAGCGCLPIPFIANYQVAIMCFWVCLFAGAFFFPILTGVMLCDMEPHLKEHANSYSQLSFNLFGFLPAPTLYGYANSFDVGNEIHSNYGMILILWTVIPISICTVMVWFLREDKSYNYQESPSRLSEGND